MGRPAASFLEPGEAARRLGVSVERVRQLAAAGLLPVAARTGRGVRLFQRAAVERLRRQRAQQAAAPR